MPTLFWIDLHLIENDSSVRSNETKPIFDFIYVNIK